MNIDPSRRKIYHITHVDNLAPILSEGALICDRAILERGGPACAVGMSSIKRRRVETLPVGCHPGTKVGDYVPFYFCPRSIMLFVIYRANHPELDYRGGQEPIVHLEADLTTAVEWAESNGVGWAFSKSNAGAHYAEFSRSPGDLQGLDWEAIDERDFRAPDVKEKKQAEFLIQGRFPIHLIQRVGVHSAAVRNSASELFGVMERPPLVEVCRDWYF